MFKRNLQLKKFNSFGTECMAEFFASIKSESEIIQIINSGFFSGRRRLIIGGGSNLLFTRDFHGVILKPDIPGIFMEEEDPERVIVSAGAGVNWDDFVAWAVKQNFGGIENLSLIPGTVGATPVQNIGAYGEEIKEYITGVRAFSTEDGTVKWFSNAECRFSYRNSIFKNELKGQYIITRVYFRLFKERKFNLSYGKLKEVVESKGEITLNNIREAVIKIRKEKLPDPEITGNAGSFFKNPVVDELYAESLRKEFPDIPVFLQEPGRVKLAAGWLIEKCGWKGKRIGNAGVHDKQALVIVNYGNATGREILELSEMIRKSVYEKFGIKLEREVEVVD